MEEPKGKSYEGPSGVGRDSIWLTQEDLVEGKDQEVTIEDVVLFPEVKFQGGRTRLNMLALRFKGKSRLLGLNATNRKSLNKAFGNIVKAWKGQTIRLYVAETQMAGETVKCVRIRNAKARALTAAEDMLNDQPNGDEPKAEVAVDPREAYRLEAAKHVRDRIAAAKIPPGEVDAEFEKQLDEAMAEFDATHAAS